MSIALRAPRTVRLRLDRQRSLQVFFVLLHILVALKLWGAWDSARIAIPVVLASSIPVIIAAHYFATGSRHGWSSLDRSILLYAAWSVLSGLAYFQPGAPSTPLAYFYGLYHFVLPLACYFAGRTLDGSQAGRVARTIVLLNGIALAYGVYLHLARPGYYRSYLVESMLSSQGYTEEWQYFSRLQTYFGSTTAAILGPASLVVMLMLEPTRRTRFSFFLLAGVFVVATLFTMQRGGFIALGIALLYLLRRRFNRRLLPALGLGAGLILVVTVASRVKSEGVSFGPRLFARATTGMSAAITEMASDRGYAPGLRYLAAFPLGAGLGASSSAAEATGLATMGQVVDANFMRIAADLGWPGLAVFLLFAGLTFRSAWHSQHPSGWTCLLTIHYGVMLVTNILDSYYVYHSFWLFVGIMESDRRSISSTSLSACML